ncbi:MAG: hypothetical protein U1F59_11330 [Candidatus Competibacteraceae bacterium]
MQPNLRVTGSGLVAAGVVACIATLTGFAGRLWWVLELTCHFRVQYALALGLGALMMLAWRQFTWTAVFAVFALLDAATIAPRFLTDVEAAAGGDDPTFRALLANVNFDNRDYPRIRQAITDHDPDFVVLLEVTPWLLDRLVDLADRYPHRAAVPRADPFGIALLSRHPFLKAEVIQIGGAGLPSIQAEFATGGQRFTLLATHPRRPSVPKPQRDGTINSRRSPCLPGNPDCWCWAT